MMVMRDGRSPLEVVWDNQLEMEKILMWHFGEYTLYDPNFTYIVAELESVWDQIISLAYRMDLELPDNILENIQKVKSYLMVRLHESQTKESAKTGLRETVCSLQSIWQILIYIDEIEREREFENQEDEQEYEQEYENE